MNLTLIIQIEIIRNHFNKELEKENEIENKKVNLKSN